MQPRPALPVGLVAVPTLVVLVVELPEARPMQVAPGLVVVPAAVPPTPAPGLPGALVRVVVLVVHPMLVQQVDLVVLPRLVVLAEGLGREVVPMLVGPALVPVEYLSALPLLFDRSHPGCHRRVCPYRRHRD